VLPATTAAVPWDHRPVNGIGVMPTRLGCRGLLGGGDRLPAPSTVLTNARGVTANRASFIRSLAS
jgi:hypothetical protein